jgi:hypothetical protein
MYIDFLKEAEDEMNEAADYYNERRSNLGTAFLVEISDGLQFIKQFPDASPIIKNRIRVKHLRRFPYSIVYETFPDRISVYSIANQKRRPLYWLDRLKN